MTRNIMFSQNFLYFITKNHHRLVQIDLEKTVQKVKAGEQCPPENEEGKILGVAISDFTVDEEGTVWVLCEDSSVEKLGADPILCKKA